MSISEAAVVLVGLFAGYWLVSKLLFRSGGNKRPGPQAEPSPRPLVAAHRHGWQEILGVTSTASAEEIRAAYKHLVSKYHPDKVATLGQELKDLAEHKTQEITQAYRDAMRARGEVF